MLSQSPGHQTTSHPLLDSAWANSTNGRQLVSRLAYDVVKDVVVYGFWMVLSFFGVPLIYRVSRDTKRKPPFCVMTVFVYCFFAFCGEGCQKKNTPV